ncbi:MAG TPA: alpha/beta fold hydrolase [Methylophilus sp.]
MLAKLKVDNANGVTACVIWLHGLGADGNDFATLVQALNLQHIRFILPHAPYQKVTLNNGYEMRAWYDIYSLDRDSQQDDAGIRKTQTSIEALIQQQIDAGIPPNRIALAGFSQGGAIALHTALRYPQRLAGVLALSTYLPLKNTLAAEKHGANQNTPIFIAHGSFDEVISIDTCLASRQLLTEQGYTVDWHEYAMAHAVHPDEVDDIRQFLLRILPN